MKRAIASSRSLILCCASTLLALFVPVVLFAQGIQPPPNFGGVGTTVTNVMSFLNSFIVPLIIAIATLVFIWGAAKSFVIGGASEESRGEGKKLMLWGVIGFVLIVSVWGLTNVIAQSLGFTGTFLKSVPPIPIPGGGTYDQPPPPPPSCAPNC